MLIPIWKIFYLLGSFFGILKATKGIRCLEIRWRLRQRKNHLSAMPWENPFCPSLRKLSGCPSIRVSKFVRLALEGHQRSINRDHPNLMPAFSFALWSVKCHATTLLPPCGHHHSVFNLGLHLNSMAI